MNVNGIVNHSDDSMIDWHVAFKDAPKSIKYLSAKNSGRPYSRVTYSMLSPFVFAASMLNFGVTVRRFA